MARLLRTQLFVERRIQGALLWRTIAYWFLCLAAVGLMLVIWRMVVSPDKRLAACLIEVCLQYGPAAAASLGLLPILLVDSVRVSNRLAAPIVRLRSGLRRLAAGEAVEPLEFRSDDFWRELAAEFNAVSARLQTAQNSTEARVAEQDVLSPPSTSTAEDRWTARTPVIAPR